MLRNLNEIREDKSFDLLTEAICIATSRAPRICSTG